MESFEAIKTSCVEILENFQLSLKKNDSFEISTEYLFVPQFIDDSNPTGVYPENNSEYYSKILSAEKTDLNGLVNIIHKYQTKISWVDFRLCSSDPHNSVYIVYLVCLNKTGNKLKFHISCPTELLSGKTPRLLQHINIQIKSFLIKVRQKLYFKR